MKRVHIVGAGGVAGIGMTRCLKDEYLVQGHDTSPWGELAMECDDETKESIHYSDVIIPIPDGAILGYVSHSSTFLPTAAEVELCSDKAKLAKAIGDIAAKTYWQRDTTGAGGQGAQMISEYLPGRNYSVEFAFNKGDLIGYFMKRRVSYLTKRYEPMVTASGSSAVSVCVYEAPVLQAARTAIGRLYEATGQLPHGFYGVDLREDENGEPKVTEINAGRLLTASYTYFYSTGYNLALAGIKSYFNEPYELGEYPEGWGVIRQTDAYPTICPPEVTKDWL